jgi:hypothetical protein
MISSTYTNRKMSVESNNQICSHSNLLFGVTVVVADAEEVAVELLEALGSNVARYATQLAYYSTTSARRRFCTRRGWRLGLIGWWGRSCLKAIDRTEAPSAWLTIGSGMSGGAVRRSQQGGVVCRRVIKFLSASRILTMLRGLELRVQVTNLHRCGTVINHLIECIILLGKTSEDVGD